MDLQGSSPIEYLKYNITDAFEQIYKTEKLKIDIKQGLIKPSIFYEIGGDKIKPPHVRDGAIYVQENYLSFLWAFIYGCWVQFEELVMKGELRQKGETLITDNNIVEDAIKLTEWAITSCSEFTNWPDNLPSPNPNAYKSKNEKFYITRVNGVFIDALSMILFHEVAHLKFKHEQICNEIEDAVWKECEKECDVYGIECVVDESIRNNEDLFQQKTISIIFSFSANLFITNNPLLICQKRHPDLDDRLFNAFGLLNIEEKYHQYYVYKLADLIIRHYRNIHREYYDGIKQFFKNKLVETAKELFLEDIEVLKKK